MANVRYLHRLKIFLFKGSTIGAIAAFYASILYIFLFIAIFLLFGKPTTVVGVLLGCLILSFGMGILGGIPAIMVGTIGGAIMGFVFSLSSKKLNGNFACFVGFIVAIPFIACVYYLSWLFLINAPYSPDITFFEYLSPPSNFLEMMLGNIYFSPSIIAFLISPYVAWKINEVTEPGTNLQQIEVET